MEHMSIRSEISPAFSAHIGEPVLLHKLASGFRFIEGPVWDEKRERLFFNDIKGNAIYTWSETQGTAIFRDNSYLSNGNALDTEGNLITCEHGTSRVSRTTVDGRYEVIAAAFDGRELNSPNDVIVRSDGMVFFTDPPSGRGAGYGIPRKQELSFQGVYACNPETGELTLLVDDFEFPNGLCLSLDEQYLFVNDSRRQHIRKFKLLPGLKLEECPLFAALPQDFPGVADGMKFDSRGFLYTTGSGGILVYDPGGKLVARFFLPEQTANLAWGGNDKKRLFITASTTLYAIDFLIPGV